MVPFVSGPKVGTIPMLCPQTCWARGTPSSATHLSLCPLPAPCWGGSPMSWGGAALLGQRGLNNWPVVPRGDCGCPPGMEPVAELRPGATGDGHSQGQSQEGGVQD